MLGGDAAHWPEWNVYQPVDVADAEDAEGEAGDEDEEEGDENVVPRASKMTKTFMPAETFEGSKEGFVFKMGEKGLGYYLNG